MEVQLLNLSRYWSLDLETFLIIPGNLAPDIVTGSWADVGEDRNIRGGLFPSVDEIILEVEKRLIGDTIFVGANIAFDFACIARRVPRLLALIFKAYREGRVHDVQIVQALDAIAGGHLARDPRTGGGLRNPATGEPTTRYALATVCDLVLDDKSVKENALFRASYAIFDGIEPSRWPPEAQIYPVDDTKNALRAAIAQLIGWNRGLDPERGPARNLDDLAVQCEAAFALHLGACWGLRTNGDRVRALAAEVEEKHVIAVKKARSLGWVRENGSEDQVALKRAVVLAYGASGICEKCGGGGRVRVPLTVECRGVKTRGRFAGCGGSSCDTCGGSGSVEKLSGERTCAESFGGCGGTGLDLLTVPTIPKTDKRAISTSRDTLMESGDEDLSEYGDAVFEKIRTTYVPYLRRGIDRPVTFRPNPVVASGRSSYDTIHQMPRKGGVRECFCARPGCVLCSTDFASGELCTLGQYCLWTVGHSRMVEIINQTQDPGSLHTFLAAKMLSISFDEARARVKAGDKQVKDFRQTAKIADFGFGSAMSEYTFVLSSREKSKGVTKLPDGTELAGIRFCVLVGGEERCGKTKLTEWKRKPRKPACKACVEIVAEVVRPAFFDAYPEMDEYHDWIAKRADAGEDALCLVWDKEHDRVVVSRRRGGCGFTDSANNGFQALLADIFKRAYINMTREAYLGIMEDGTPSPLAGARFPVGLHDEPIAELKRKTAHISAPRIGKIMEKAGQDLAPDVFWKAEPAIAEFWSKDMEPVFDPNTGDLVLWEPKASV